MFMLLADKIVDRLIEKNRIKEEQGVAYALFFEGVFYALSLMFLAALIGLFMGHVTDGLVLMAAYLGIRNLAGGYHFECLPVGAVMYALIIASCIFLAHNLEFNVPFMLICFVLALVMLIITPIEVHERDFTKEKGIKYRKIMIFVLTYYLAIATFFYRYNMSSYTLCIFFSVLICFFFAIPAFLKQYYRYDKPQSWSYME